MNSEKFEEVKALGNWVATQYEKLKGETKSKMLRDIINLIANGNPGDKIFFHGNPIKYEEAGDYLYLLVSHPRAFQDSIPQHIDPALWYEKLMELGHAIKSL